MASPRPTSESPSGEGTINVSKSDCPSDLECLDTSSNTFSIDFCNSELFAQTFATNSTLDDTGHIPPTPRPSDYFIPKTKILPYEVFHALSGLDSRKAYGQ